MLQLSAVFFNKGKSLQRNVWNNFLENTQYVMKKSWNFRIVATEDRHDRRETLCLV